MHLGHDKEQTEKRYAKVTSAMITARKKAKSGLSAIDEYIFTDGEGNIASEIEQEVGRTIFANWALRNPSGFTYEIQNGELTPIFLVSEEQYNEIITECPEHVERRSDGTEWFEADDGFYVLLRLRR